MKQVVIKRSQWTAGAFFRLQEDTYCALGFAMKSAGLRGADVTRALTGRCLPNGERTNVDPTAERLVAAGLQSLVCPVRDRFNGEVVKLNFNHLADRIMDINDKHMDGEINNRRVLNPERERQLTEAFKEANLELVFED